MDSSFSVVHATPTPATRRPLNTLRPQVARNPSLLPTFPTNPNSHPPKAVRFSPARDTLPTVQPSYSTPLPAARPAPSPPLNRLAFTTTESPRKFAQYPTASLPTPPRQGTRAIVPVSNGKSPVAKALAPPSASRSVLPAGRGEVARRLRVNSVLLVGWWILSRAQSYVYVAGYLVELMPSLDSPLHFLETGSLILIVYNIIESLYRLNSLSIVQSTVSPVAAGTPGRFMPPTRAASPFGTPQSRSSPKTRPSPSMANSPSLSRSLPSSFPHDSPLKSISPVHVRQSPSLLASTPTTRRRSLLANPAGSPGGNENVSPKMESSPLTAFMARHSPVASSLHRSLSDRQSLDRLLNGSD